MSFNARKISPEIRDSVQELLDKNKKSFDPAVSFQTLYFDHNLYVHLQCTVYEFPSTYKFSYFSYTLSTKQIMINAYTYVANFILFT